METVASIRSVSKEFRTGDTVVTALKDATAEFRNNELTLIIGPSGSGKTTLLSLLGCVLFPSSGEVFIKDKLVNGLNEKELARLRLENIGFVFQNFNLIAPLTSVENVMQPLMLMGMNTKEASDRATDALSRVGMQDKVKVLPRNLSGGQQQRVAIARALVTNPSLMLCDEPTAALDIRSVKIVMEELRMLSDSGKSVAVVTHDFRLKSYADRIIYVNNGMVSDTPSEEEVLN